MGRFQRNGVVRGAYTGSPNGDYKLYADSTGMQSKLGPGVVIVGGFMGESTGITVLAHNPAHASQHRYDRIVARLSTVSPYTISVEVVQGSNATTQVNAANSMATLGPLDVPLGYVYIAPGSSSISAGNVTVERVWTQPVAISDWADYTPVINTAAGSAFTISSSSFSRARYRYTGASCEISIGGLIALAGGGTGGLTISLPTFAKFLASPLSGDAFNDIARSRTTAVGGLSSFCDLFPPAGHTWPTDGIQRGFVIHGSFEVATGS
jgi:hypothetical protein